MPTDTRLKLYIVCCDADKPLAEEPVHSVYEYPIQAGTALTDKRICSINDMNDCSDNISSRNRRYSECTAMYWIYKHIDTSYVGIEHYRRRLDISDSKYSSLMDDNVDIITTVPMIMKHAADPSRSLNIEEHYRLTHYAADWDLFMDILKQHHPDDLDYACECFSEYPFHPCNINVFRSEIYKEFCEWAFPLCDEFYRRSPEKTDVFQHRDVGYIMERLSHLFVMQMKRTGKSVFEAPLIEYQPINTGADNNIDLNNPSHVFDQCNMYFCANQITNAHRLLDSAMSTDCAKDERIRLLARLFVAYLNERSELPQTMFEYLHPEFRTDLNILTQIWNGFEQAVMIYHETQSEEALNKLTQYMNLTGFSKSALRTAIAIGDGKDLI